MSSRQQTEKPRITEAPAKGTAKSRPKAWKDVEAMHRAEMEWLKHEGPQYEGQWVALEGSQLLSHGLDALEVLEQARAQGVVSPLLVRVPHGPELPFGGW